MIEKANGFRSITLKRPISVSMPFNYYIIFACVYTEMPRAVLAKGMDNEIQQRSISASDPSLLGNDYQQTITEESDSASVQTPAETEGEELKVGCHVTSM